MRPSNKYNGHNSFPPLVFDSFLFTTFLPFKASQYYDILECSKKFRNGREIEACCIIVMGTANSGKTIEILKVAYNYESAERSRHGGTSALDTCVTASYYVSSRGMKRPAIAIEETIFGYNSRLT